MPVENLIPMVLPACVSPLFLAAFFLFFLHFHSVEERDELLRSTALKWVTLLTERVWTIFTLPGCMQKGECLNVLQEGGRENPIHSGGIASCNGARVLCPFTVQPQLRLILIILSAYANERMLDFRLQRRMAKLWFSDSQFISIHQPGPDGPGRGWLCLLRYHGSGWPIHLIWGWGMKTPL